MSHCISFHDLLAYRAGELSPDADDRVEEHFFECAQCASRLDDLERLREAVARLVREGRVRASVTAEFLEAAARDGVRVRTYELDPGETVFCTIAPDDDFVATRFRGAFEDLESVDLRVASTMQPTGERDTQWARSLLVDVASGELVMLHSGHAIRSLPRARFELEVRAPDDRVLASYALEHSPWDEHESR
jgi:hypothetical protein